MPGTTTIYSLTYPTSTDYVKDGATAITTLATNIGTNVPPPGTLLAFAGSAAPAGFLLCYGQAISRTTYSALFAVVSTTYGAGDGSTTFNVPDLRGRVIAGVDNMGGAAAGRLTGTTMSPNGNTRGATGGAQTNTHNHYQSVGNDGSTIYVSAFTNQPRSKVVTVSRANLASGGNIFAVARFDSTDNETINTIPPTILVNYLIKT